MAGRGHPLGTSSSAGSYEVGGYLVVLKGMLEVGEGVVVAAEETEVGDDGLTSFCP